MRDKIRIGIITFLITMVIMLLLFNFFDESTKKIYSFNRKFISKDSILNFQKSFKKMNEDEYVMGINSDNCIVERDKNNIDKNNDQYRFYINNLVFSKKQIVEVVLPINSNVLFCDLEQVIFTNHFLMYKYNILTKTIFELKIPKVKVTSLKPILNSKSKFLCFGEVSQNQFYNTCFFTLDFKSSNIEIVKILGSDSETNIPKNALMYSGKFWSFSENKLLSFCCDKYCKIYFFDNNGIFIKELSTLDNTPLPSIIQNEQGFSFYSRQGTWFSNMGLFLEKDKIFVFSSSTEKKINTEIIVDQYSFNDLKYIQSFKINYNNQASASIRNVFIKKEAIIIGFEFNYASFVFSRYIM